MVMHTCVWPQALLVGADVQHVIRLIENVLCAVSMVDIPVQYQHLRQGGGRRGRAKDYCCCVCICKWLARVSPCCFTTWQLPSGVSSGPLQAACCHCMLGNAGVKACVLQPIQPPRHIREARHLHFVA